MSCFNNDNDSPKIVLVKTSNRSDPHVLAIHVPFNRGEEAFIHCFVKINIQRCVLVIFSILKENTHTLNWYVSGLLSALSWSGLPISDLRTYTRSGDKCAPHGSGVEDGWGIAIGPTPPPLTHSPTPRGSVTSL
jgi:hypothetical protein